MPKEVLTVDPGFASDADQESGIKKGAVLGEKNTIQSSSNLLSA